jgi:hypothetical protein
MPQTGDRCITAAYVLCHLRIGLAEHARLDDSWIGTARERRGRSRLPATDADFEPEDVQPPSKPGYAKSQVASLCDLPEPDDSLDRPEHCQVPDRIGSAPLEAWTNAEKSTTNSSVTSQASKAGRRTRPLRNMSAPMYRAGSSREGLRRSGGVRCWNLRFAATPILVLPRHYRDSCGTTTSRRPTQPPARRLGHPSTPHRP